MKRYFVILFSAVVLFLAACTKPEKFENTLAKFHDAKANYILVAAHRGGHNGHPENSLSAYQHAIEAGVDIGELDVRVTKDSIVFLMHDGKIDRTTNGTGIAEDFTWAELQNFRLKMPDGTLTDEKIPTFGEVLNLVKGKMMIDIDIKTSRLKPVVDAVKQSGTENQVFYFDDDYESLTKVRSLEPNAMLMPRAHNFHEADSATVRFYPQVVHIDEKFYSLDLTQMLRNRHARVWINALGEPDKMIRQGNMDGAMMKLLTNHANIIQTDEPEKILAYLRAKGLHD